MKETTDVGTAIALVRERIAAAAARAGRDPSTITLVAVTKTVEADRARLAVEAGVADLGESRAQELRDKRGRVPGARWHFIGPLQRNKARLVNGVALIHSVESQRLAEAIGRDAVERSGTQDVLIEVNTAGDPAKHGCAPADAERLAGAVAAVDGVRLRGLMTIAPLVDDKDVRRAFASLRTLGERIARSHPGADQLSMGMSSDFELAVEEGATIVRIGSAIFGERATRGDEPGLM